MERSYGGDEPRHPLDWLAWPLEDLVQEAQRLDLPQAQCLSVAVTLPGSGSNGADNPLSGLRWDRSFGFVRGL